MCVCMSTRDGLLITTFLTDTLISECDMYYAGKTAFIIG